MWSFGLIGRRGRRVAALMRSSRLTGDEGLQTGITGTLSLRGTLEDFKQEAENGVGCLPKVARLAAGRGSGVWPAIWWKEPIEQVFATWPMSDASRKLFDEEPQRPGTASKPVKLQRPGEGRRVQSLLNKRRTRSLEPKANYSCDSRERQRIRESVKLLRFRPRVTQGRRQQHLLYAAFKLTRSKY